MHTVDGPEGGRTFRAGICLAGVQTSGHSRSEEMKENEGSSVRQQPAKRPAQTVHAQKSLTVPRSPRLGRLNDQVKQVIVSACSLSSTTAFQAKISGLPAILQF